MKKALSALLAIAAIQAPLTGHASDTITFTGKLVPTTCTVTGAGSPFNVELPRLAVADLKPTAGLTTFSLNITGCTTQTTATAHFDGGSINTNTGRLTNTAPGGPTDVELELRNAGTNTSAINLAGNFGNQSVAPAAIDATLHTAKANFAVQYYYTGATEPAPGDIASNVTYTMVYQ